MESIDSFVNSNETNIPLIEHIQNNEYFIEASIMSLINKARLKFYLTFEDEGKIKIPKKNLFNCE